MDRKSIRNSAMTVAGLAGAAGLVLAFAPSGAQAGAGFDGPMTFGAEEEYGQLPMSITLTGVVRDFRERGEEGGHPDFERRPNNGFGHYMGNIAERLDDAGKPVFEGGGNKIVTQWKDSRGRPIHPSLYDSSKGDSAGTLGMPDSGGVDSADSFTQWFRDIPGVNASQQVAITLNRAEGSNVYTFDDRHDADFSQMGGFFPINGQLFGNSSGEEKNFHFTYELSTEFQYRSDSGQIFTFNGDDDVWVFIDDRLVIDIGGVHSRVTQTVDLDRLDWLEDGETYSLKFFFAERHRTQSNFRIETTLNLRNAELPPVAGMFD